MNNTYLDLVKQTFNFPQEGFEVKDEYLQFNGLDIKALIDKYGTPLKLSYLPKIGMQIKKAKKMFDVAFKNTSIPVNTIIATAPKARIFLLL